VEVCVVLVAMDEDSYDAYSVLVVGSVVPLSTASVVPTEEYKTYDPASESSCHWSSSTHGSTML
jgi:hypothetical protein